MKKENYTAGFKKQAALKGFSRGNRSLQEISKDLNIGLSSLTRWMKLSEPTAHSKKIQVQRPQDWTVEARWSALAESHALTGESLNTWCRTRGLFVHYLSARRDQFCTLTLSSKSDVLPELRQLKQENQRLQNQLSRKDKALAEAAALLVLQKNSKRSGRTRTNDLPNSARDGTHLSGTSHRSRCAPSICLRNNFAIRSGFTALAKRPAGVMVARHGIKNPTTH